VRDLTELTTVLTPYARQERSPNLAGTLYQAFLLRTLLAKEYDTFIYLMHNNTIQPVQPSHMNLPSTAFLYAMAPAEIVTAVQVVELALYPTLPVE